MHTVIIGRRSNLSEALHAATPGSRVLGATELLEAGPDALAELAGDAPLRVVVNAFQPATRLRDYSDPIGYVDRAIGVTARVLAALDPCPIAHLVYTSSASVYGDNIHCSEDDAVQPRDLHASLKVANEHLVRNVCRDRGVHCTVARVFNMYGGDDRFSVVSKVIRAARDGATLTLVNGGNAIRDFVHIDDVVRAFGAIADAHGQEPGVELVNIASGRGVSIAGMVDALRRAGHHVDTSDTSRSEIRMSTANVERLNRLLPTDSFRRVEDFVLDEVQR